MNKSYIIKSKNGITASVTFHDGKKPSAGEVDFLKSLIDKAMTLLNKKKVKKNRVIS